jgi:hypothetical protein
MLLLLLLHRLHLRQPLLLLLLLLLQGYHRRVLQFKLLQVGNCFASICKILPQIPDSFQQLRVSCFIGLASTPAVPPQHCSTA